MRGTFGLHVRINGGRSMMFYAVFSNGRTAKLVCRNNGEAIKAAQVLAKKLGTTLKTCVIME